MQFVSLWRHITTNNLVPYVAIVGMAIVMYFLWQSNIKKDIALQQSEANFESFKEAFATQAKYVNARTDAIEKAVNEKFSLGVKVETLTYTIE